ncbi:helix-turn-helix domain-containing protein [Peptostreptococcus sp. D1]|uniref:helix-turn-helix domain-containing protein n=1 Tax=Peptostreptococcus sp. D1 TaxID=72304 RepID=UPI0008EB08E0|nr:helix-turn-helix transcriptional regulator [Peptostreptococcus sp. D1]SFE89320.1 Helix-turn-helix [Peptostreptococcus sp. D1]
MNTFGMRLKELRENMNLTQTELASKFNVTPPSISQYEKDVRSPDYELLIKIADFFDVSTDYLLGRTDIEKTNIETVAAHRTNGNTSDIKDVEGLKNLIRQVIEEEKNK